MLDIDHLLKSLDFADLQLLLTFASLASLLIDVAGDTDSHTARVGIIELGGVVHAHHLLALEAIDRLLGLLVTGRALSRDTVSHFVP